jgi:hypothetical protein
MTTNLELFKPADLPTMTIRGDGARLSGFQYWWAKRVRGFKGTTHCAQCLLGPWVSAVKKDMLLNTPVELAARVDEVPFIYLCGVKGAQFNGKRWISSWAENFHLAMRPKPGARAQAETYNGFVVTVENTEALELPPLPRSWRRLPPSMTTCRNFQFGVAYFGESTVEDGVCDYKAYADKKR